MSRSIGIEQNVDVRFATGAQALRSRAEHLVLDDVERGTVPLQGDGGGEESRRAVVTVGHPHELDAHAVEVPIRLTAVEQPERFPTFEGTIELSALSEHPPQSQLALIGAVTSPSSLLGKLTASTRGFDLEATLRAMLDQVADRLRAASQEHAPS